MAVDHALEQLIHYVVEGEAGIFRWVHAHTGFKSCVDCKPLFYSSYAELIIFREVRAEVLVELLDNLRQRFESFVGKAINFLRSNGIDFLSQGQLRYNKIIGFVSTMESREGDHAEPADGHNHVAFHRY